jgi:hypothetical protein
MSSMKKSNTCSWCFQPTDLPEVFAAEVPILEWMENKIDKYCDEHDISREELWGETSDWNRLDLDEGWEMELLAYDDLIATIKRKIICKECLMQDDKLFKKYYISPQDDWDIEFEP